jgi:hypothetical protein
VKYDNWIDEVMNEVLNVETPRSWIWWSLCSAVSAAAGNNYRLITLKGNLVYKPNIYVILLGDSGLGKGFGINLAKLLVQAANVTRVIAGRSSIQAIVQELGTAKSRENGDAPFTDSRGFVVNGELSSAVITDPDSLTILTDLYDGHYNPEWTNLLKGDGAKKLTEPYITTLFGSSQSHFYEKIPQANIEGGYIGRTLIVYEEKRFQNIDLLDTDNDLTDRLKDRVIPEYAKHLRTIAANKGRMIPTDIAKGLYNSWRKTWRTNQVHDKTGFLNRVPDHVLKVSMCLSLARYGSQYEINEFDMSEAIEKVTRLVHTNNVSMEVTGLDPLVNATRFVLNQLIASSNNELTRKILLSRGLGMYQNDGLDKIIDNLLEIGWISRERKVAGKASDWIIKLAGEPLEKLMISKKAKENGNG